MSESIQDEIKRVKRLCDQKINETVAVALFGQPGAGKSSLINSLLGRNAARVGVRADTTIDEASYDWNGLKLVDLPGYDTKRFPKAGYFERFRILDRDLFLCVVEGKLHGWGVAALWRRGVVRTFHHS